MRERNAARLRTASRAAWLAGAVALAAAVGVGVYLARRAPPATSAPPGRIGTAPSAAPAPAAPSIAHPIENAAGANESAAPVLPPLDASDVAVADALKGLAGVPAFGALINPEHVIQRIVATIDSLPRQKLSPDALPIRGASGTFVASNENGKTEIDPRNYERYEPYAQIADAIDAKALIAWYVRFYPLFQEAYREQGYPDGYFNDRLVFVIDHLLDTPDLHGPVALRQPGVLYEFADPALENRSAGQKLLLRSGPENERAIKAKLRAIRAALTSQEAPATDSPSSSSSGGATP